MRKTLSSGAESIIYVNDRHNIEKDRIRKSYRIREIDEPLRLMRTKRELKVISALNKMKFPVPKIIGHTDTNIEMEYIEGVQVKRILDEQPMIARIIGERLAMMHDADIIHGDLTTSNMIMKNNLLKDHNLNGIKDGSLYFIDFGLSFFSKRIEDKAVDLHLFKQALESKHFRVQDEALKHFMDGYAPRDRQEILKRLHVVEQRGRYKEKV